MSQMWWFRILAFCSVVVTVAVCVTLWLVIPSIVSKQDLLVQSSSRADCRSEYNSRLQEQKDRLVNLRAESQLTFNRATIARYVNVPVDLQAAYNEFVATDKQLRAQARLVEGLPRLDQTVDHGFTLRGVRYPPCPKVG